MTDDHKDAIRQGRLQSSAVKAYLESLGVARRRGSDPGSLKKRLEQLEERLAAESNVLRALELRQERIDLQRAVEAATPTAASRDLEKEFVQVAKEYGARKGITYTAWRQMGVSPRVLSQAGIKR